MIIGELCYVFLEWVGQVLVENIYLFVKYL